MKKGVTILFFSLLSLASFCLILTLSMIDNNKDKTKKNNDFLSNEDTSSSGFLEFNKNISSDVRNNRQAIMETKEIANQLLKNQEEIQTKIISLADKNVMDTIQEEDDNLTNFNPMEQEDVLTIFESVYMEEDIDEAWSVSAQYSLQNAVNHAIENIEDMTLNALDCLSSLCKVDYSLKSESTFEDTFDILNHNIDWESKAFSSYEVDENGQINVVAFFMREGKEYPNGIGR